MVAARAVRKAVNSDAARKAYGAPVEARSVREPIGEVDCEDAAVEWEGARESFDNCDAGVAGRVEVLVDRELEVVDWEFNVEAVV